MLRITLDSSDSESREESEEDDFEERVAPNKEIYYWLKGKFTNPDKGEDTDEFALSQGFASVVPTQFDLTAHHAISDLNKWGLSDQKS